MKFVVDDGSMYTHGKRADDTKILDVPTTNPSARASAANVFSANKCPCEAVSVSATVGGCRREANTMAWRNCHSGCCCCCCAVAAPEVAAAALLDSGTQKIAMSKGLGGNVDDAM